MFLNRDYLVSNANTQQQQRVPCPNKMLYFEPTAQLFYKTRFKDVRRWRYKSNIPFTAALLAQ